jgi:hypothetical protein
VTIVLLTVFVDMQKYMAAEAVSYVGLCWLAISCAGLRAAAVQIVDCVCRNVMQLEEQANA